MQVFSSASSRARCPHLQCIAKIFTSKLLFPKLITLSQPSAPGGFSWEPAGHFQPGMQLGQLKSFTSLSPSNLILQSHFQFCIKSPALVSPPIPLPSPATADQTELPIQLFFVHSLVYVHYEIHEAFHGNS